MWCVLTVRIRESCDASKNGELEERREPIIFSLLQSSSSSSFFLSLSPSYSLSLPLVVTNPARVAPAVFHSFFPYPFTARCYFYHKYLTGVNVSSSLKFTVSIFSTEERYGRDRVKKVEKSELVLGCRTIY